MSENSLTALVKKSCFGSYENGDNSWHCSGCIIVEECKKFKEPNQPIESNKVNRPNKDNYYLDIALAVSKRSTCIKRHYGCVIVKDDVIVATGYNGSPRGEENCCDKGICNRVDAERYSNYEFCPSVHAEQNAIMSCSRENLMGATLYLACEEYGVNEDKSALWEEEIIDFHEDKNPIPCGICLKMIKNAGINKIINRSGEVYVCDRSPVL